MPFTRRQFIKIGATGAGATAAALAASGRWSFAAARPDDPHTNGDRVVPTFCELCFWKCGVLAHVRDGRVTKIVGNPAHPLSRGRICPRGTGGTGLLYDPDRLKTPLIRVNKRGEDVFQEASWDSALERVATELDRVRKAYGPEALALFTHGWGGSWFNRLMAVYGSPNIAAPSYAQCRGPREAGFQITYGQGLGSPEAIDIENARCIVLLGSHLGENMHNTQVQEFADAIGKGAEVVVVDPRFSVAASKARYWLPIKPGTDIALLLAWMNVIISEKRYDAEYIAKYATGFDELAKHVETKTPEWAYPITGIDPDLIRDSARLISSFRPQSLIHPGRHATWYGDDTQRLRAIAILAALLGSWGRRGGYILPSAMDLPKFPAPKPSVTPRPATDKPSSGHYPIADEIIASGVCDATVTTNVALGENGYPIKAWMVYGTNLMQSLPNPAHTQKAIQALDFIATIDVLPAEIAGWSDVVLPEATYLERYDDAWAPAWKQPFIAIRQPAVDAMYDSKPGWWIAKEIASRLGLAGEYGTWKEPTEILEWRLKAAGYDFNQVRKTGVVIGEKPPICEEDGLALSFDTESKKIELSSNMLKTMGFAPIPDYTPPDEPPAGMFRLLSGRASVHTFGRTTNNRMLADCFEENEVWINTDAAAALQGFEDKPLRNGEYVILENQDGVKSTPVRAKVTQRIRGDAVYMVHGFGHSAKGLKQAHGRGASDSDLVTQIKVDPLMGGTGMNVNFVRIVRAEVNA